MRTTSRDSLANRFWKHVDKKEPNECWNWTAATAHGYGRIGSGSFPSEGRPRILLAHRVSYEIHFGEIPSDMMVCHRCDNKRCVNPNHLFLGSQMDNILDAVSKGRISGLNRFSKRNSLGRFSNISQSL